MNDSIDVATETGTLKKYFGVLLGPVVLDVDDDCKSGMAPLLRAALSHYLPYTPYTFGPEARPAAHRLYHVGGDDAGEFAALRRAQTRVARFLPEALEGVTNVEPRFGGHLDDAFLVLPPAVHKTDGPRRWVDAAAVLSTTPPVVEAAEVSKSIKLAISAAILAAVWPSNNRNKAAMALAGALYRVALTANSTGIDGLVLLDDKDSIGDFVEYVAELAGDDEWRTRKKEASYTFNKLDKNAPVSGVATLAELTGESNLIQAVVGHMLSTNEAAIKIDEFMAEFAFKTHGDTVAVLPRAGEHRFDFQSRQNFRGSNSRRRVELPGAEKPVELSLIAMNSKRAAEFVDVTFDPSTPARFVNYPVPNEITGRTGQHLNTFTGKAIEPYVKPDGSYCAEEDVQEYADYVREIVCNGHEDRFRWLTHWMANLLQHPDQKPGTMVVLIGKQGSGKSLFFELVRRIIGPAHAVILDRSDDVTGKFNARMAYRTFVICEEAISSNQKHAAQIIKSVATSPTFGIEHKGRDKFDVPNHARLVFISNHDNATVIENAVDDRRHMVMQINDKYAYDALSPIEQARACQDYWYNLTRVFGFTSIGRIGDTTYLSKIHSYFMGIKYDMALISKPIMTEEKERMAQYSVDEVGQWLITMLHRRRLIDESGHPGAWNPWFTWDNDPTDEFMPAWPKHVYLETLHESYMRDRRGTKRGYETGLSKQMLYAELRNRGLLMPGENQRRRVADENGITSRQYFHQGLDPKKVYDYVKRRYGETVIKDIEPDFYLDNDEDDERHGPTEY